MKISVKVVSGAKKERIEKMDGGTFKIYVSAPAKEGKANKRLVELLADYFNVAKSAIRIKHGTRGPVKIIEISLY
ncbi:MAG: hypothetical protein A2932_00435 [Candidatus Spechtbacteria bacterium RIFCSPLOWO2_01_FULL_46_10]|uniref:Uncharacterized protein n=1 Tax=Candidatus Spechtbacteria bacterium RIFCSPLOWO2_01_FULL_46_10 TaxID=1802163 RepID=A0A1G2HED2_9BACT|nr:MAG: hypothetical protein A2932_00435 [Candidatus Spechtbacteria bacterium RIFCSPLOWO2_01_FULL_46_10]